MNILGINEDGITFNITEIINDLTDKELEDIFIFKTDLTVKDVVSNSAGKWPSALGNVIAIDSNYIKDYLIINLVDIAIDIISKYNPTIIIYKSIIETYIKTLFTGFNLEKY